jgi:hypothetical protein
MNKSCGQATPTRLQEQSLPTQTKYTKASSNPRRWSLSLRCTELAEVSKCGFRSCSCGFNRQAQSFVSQPDSGVCNAIAPPTLKRQTVRSLILGWAIIMEKIAS